MSMFYQKYQQYSFPSPSNEWSPIIPVNVYATQPVPFIVSPTPMLLSQICPYVPSIAIPPIVTSSVVIPNSISPISTYYESLGTRTELESPAGSFYGSDNGAKNEIEEDSIEYYLALPKDLFPSARTLAMDPNDIIDEFCKLPNIVNHAPWILDLEFGIPKCPITRHTASYNVKFNSIHCKNTPDAIHPGFESCTQDFKSVLLFYYGCIVSVLYRGYIILNCDRSVDNFQSWLLLPLQMLGMCWP